jgi:hypothetical protein
VPVLLEPPAVPLAVPVPVAAPERDGWPPPTEPPPPDPPAPDPPPPDPPPRGAPVDAGARKGAGALVDAGAIDVAAPLEEAEALDVGAALDFAAELAGAAPPREEDFLAAFDEDLARWRPR